MPEKTAETIDADGWLRDRRHRRARRRRLPEDRRPQEGADHQRGRQEHVAREHRVEAEGRQPADRPGGRDRRPAPLQRRPDRARPRLRAGVGAQNGLEGKAAEELASDEALIAAIQEGVDAANAKMSRVEQIKKFTVLPTDWAPGGDELTPTMKLKRRADRREVRGRDRDALRPLSGVGRFIIEFLEPWAAIRYEHRSQEDATGSWSGVPAGWSVGASSPARRRPRDQGCPDSADRPRARDPRPVGRPRGGGLRSRPGAAGSRQRPRQARVGDRRRSRPPVLHRRRARPALAGQPPQLAAACPGRRDQGPRRPRLPTRRLPARRLRRRGGDRLARDREPAGRADPGRPEDGPQPPLCRRADDGKRRRPRARRGDLRLERLRDRRRPRARWSGRARMGAAAVIERPRRRLQRAAPLRRPDVRRLGDRTDRPHRSADGRALVPGAARG